MLNTYYYEQLTAEKIDELVQRNTDPNSAIQDTVLEVIQEVKKHGDQALKDFTKQFDKVELDKLYLDKDEIAALAQTISREQMRALEIAFQNIHKFHQSQLKRERTVETMPGVKCWREVRPIEKVGLYIPDRKSVV